MCSELLWFIAVSILLPFELESYWMLEFLFNNVRILSQSNGSLSATKIMCLSSSRCSSFQSSHLLLLNLCIVFFPGIQGWNMYDELLKNCCSLLCHWIQVEGKTMECVYNGFCNRKSATNHYFPSANRAILCNREIFCYTDFVTLLTHLSHKGQCFFLIFHDGY